MRTTRLARGLGMTLQALIVGLALALAVIKLLTEASGGLIFRYQGF